MEVAPQRMQGPMQGMHLPMHLPRPCCRRVAGSGLQRHAARAIGRPKVKAPAVHPLRHVHVPKRRAALLEMSYCHVLLSGHAGRCCMAAGLDAGELI